MKFKLPALFSILLSFSSFAGNGSSGGGHIYGDQVNPWFLQNTKVVNYCVEVSENFSDLSEQKVKETVKEAIQIWKRSFSQSHIIESANGIFKPSPRIATQKFVESNCSITTDIKFQMGFLTGDQLKVLHNIKQTIGLAFRTSYDSNSLKAKGFIYIAPEKGELRPSSKKFAKDPWSYGNNNILLFTLVHELGHIFGLQDLPFQAKGRDIMSRHFVEMITSNMMDAYKVFDSFIQLKRKNFIVPVGTSGKYYDEFSIGNSEFSKETCDFLQFDCSVQNLYIEGKGDFLKIYEVKNDVKYLIGTLDLNSEDFEETAGIDLVNIWLPKDQKVFKMQSSYFLLESTQSLLVLNSQGRIMNTTYKSVGGVKRSVNVTFLSPTEFEISAVINGKYYPDIFFID